MATVTIQSVSKAYAEQYVLQDVNLKIDKGEFVVIVGPSGCGKSTLLRLVAGLDDVSQGSILINDKCVNRTPAPARDIAMVFQNYALYPHMTVYENMAYGLRMRGFNKKKINERVEFASKMLQLQDCMDRKPAALSGGQRQRVAMGRAIVRSPAVFLFDEPLSNLDFKLRTEMRQEIKMLHRKLNTTCIYVTHDQTEAMTLAERVVVLNQGRIEQIGSPREVYERPLSRFVASFLGHFPMNFIPGTYDPGSSKITLTEGLEFPYAKIKTNDILGSIELGIRPEHLKLSKTETQGSFSVKVEFVDDMGSDKLVRVISKKSGIPMCVRVSGETPVVAGTCFVQFDMDKAIVFCAKSGKRLGSDDA